MIGRAIPVRVEPAQRRERRCDRDRRCTERQRRRQDDERQRHEARGPQRIYDERGPELDRRHGIGIRRPCDQARDEVRNRIQRHARNRERCERGTLHPPRARLLRDRTCRRQLRVGQPEPRELFVIRIDVVLHVTHHVGAERTQRFARVLDLATDRAPARQRRIAGIVREHLGDARDQAPLLVRLSSDEQLAQVGVHLRGDRADALLAGAVHVRELAHRSPQYEAARAEVIARVEL